MAENKKYYFLKLKEDFFDQREIVVLEGSKDGVLYVNILLKLYLEHGRIYDCIMERCVPVAFSGRNYRTDKGRANMESASGILRE